MLPENVGRATEIARQAMLAHSRRELLPINRRDIYEAFRKHGITFGHLVGGFLALPTARYVYPIWTAEKPHDSAMQSTLRMADDFLHHSASVNEAMTLLGKSWDYLEQLAVTPFGNTNAFIAGFAAVKALAAVLRQDRFEEDIINEETTDRDLDQWSSDTASVGAAAYGGPVWSPEADISRREAFWRWWLNDAIPRAWDAANAERPSSVHKVSGMK